MVIDGEVGKPGTYALEDFVKPYQLEERIYRLRCVEAWSMVIPWLGFPLADLLKRVEPTGRRSSSVSKPCSVRNRWSANAPVSR